jgi:hypothetical protein
MVCRVSKCRWPPAAMSREHTSAIVKSPAFPVVCMQVLVFISSATMTTVLDEEPGNRTTQMVRHKVRHMMDVQACAPGLIFTPSVSTPSELSNCCRSKSPTESLPTALISATGVQRPSAYGAMSRYLVRCSECQSHERVISYMSRVAGIATAQLTWRPICGAFFAFFFWIAKCHRQKTQKAGYGGGGGTM